MASASTLPILIIDDAPADLEILMDYLCDGGFENVQTAVGGAAGIAALTGAGPSGEAPGVVVVDIRMPPPDGHEVLARIKAMDAGCRPLALAVTGDASQTARIAALRAGASDFITKPFDTVELLLRVRTLAEMKRQERELREALTYQQLANEYRILADNSLEVIVHHRGREVVWISPSAKATFGWSREQLLGTEFFNHIHPDDLDIMMASLDKIAQGQPITVRVRVAIAGGGYRWVEGRTTTYIDATGNPDGMIAALRVVDEEVEAERQREADLQRAIAAEARYRLLADNTGDVVVHLRGREVVWISPSAEALYGWPAESWIGTDFTPRISPEDPDAAAAVMEKIARGEPFATRVRTATADGDYRWIESHGQPYSDPGGNPDGTIISIHVVDEQVAAEQQLKADKERFEAVVANTPSAISVCDLQHRYTMVNRAFCQLFGQESVADAIGRTEDEMLPLDVLERSRQAEELLLAGESVVEEEPIDRGSENTSVVTQRFPLWNVDQEISEFATIRTDVTHRKKIEREAAERARWEDRIWTAIGDGSLLVYSQPIVDIATGDTVGEELLIRLRDNETDEILPPSAFLPQCEKHGLLPIIDRYMVGWAIDLAHAGRRVSVNITGQTIGGRKAMEEILDALVTGGREVAGRITLEITETVALASPAIAKKFSAGMRDLGCRVALDDFGTGYGAFTELRHLALDALKIDRSFVRTMLEDRDDERAVDTIISVARAYGLTTVAEGVETQAVLDRLAELGADRAQGYLFAKPEPVVW